jgi:ubiquinone/menaquinone biosynthesis C-methylase UbiE
MSIDSHTRLFSQVDRTRDPSFFVRFRDEGQKLPAIQASRRLMVERIGLRPGESVLDVGCGPGIDMFEMARIIGAEGRLVGVDASEFMVAEARRRAKDFVFPITFEVGDVYALPFPDRSFDVCCAQRVLEHLDEPVRALSEMKRVVRPGGRIGVFDFDWDTIIIDHPDKETTRMIVRSYSDSLRNGWLGRQLPRLFKEQHLEVLSNDPVQVYPHYAMCELFLGTHLASLESGGALTKDKAQRWWNHLQEANQRGMLLVSFTAFLVVGRK